MRPPRLARSWYAACLLLSAHVASAGGGDASNGSSCRSPSCRAGGVAPTVGGALSSPYYLGSKTPYWPQMLGEWESLPPQCVLVHVNHVARHGSRHATNLKAPRRLGAALREAEALGKLTPLGRNVSGWVAAYLAEEAAHLGELTPGGSQEHAGTAARLWERHAEDLGGALRSGRALEFHSTDKSRTRQSRDAFALELQRLARDAGAHPPGGDASALFALQPPPSCAALRSGDGAAAFSSLRFFDSCAAYVEYKAARPWLPRLLRFTAAAAREGSHESALLRRVFEPEFVAALASADADNQERAARKRAQAAFAAAERAAAAEDAAEGSSDDDAPPSSRPPLLDMMRRAVPPTAAFGPPAPSHKPPPSARARKLSGKTARLVKKLQEARKDRAREEKERSGGKDRGGGGGGGASGGSSKLPGIPEFVSALYESCQIEQDALGRGDRLCSLFSDAPETLAKYELLHDLGDYYKQGAGDPLAYVASCTLLEDMLASAAAGAGLARAPGALPGGGSANGAAARAARRASGDSPAGVFRFAHSETIMPILSLLGLWAQQTDEPTLEEHFSEELALGTSHLLEATRARLLELSEDNPGVDLTSEDAQWLLAPIERPHVGECHVAPGGGVSSKRGGSGGNLSDGRGEGGGKGKGKGGKGGGGSSGSSSGGGGAPTPKTPSHPSWPLGHPAADTRPQPSGFSGPLLLALKHPWAGARVSPMAANVQWLVYDCGDEGAADAGGSYDTGAASGSSGSAANRTAPAAARPLAALSGVWVKMLANEREVPFPACDAGIAERDGGFGAAPGAAYGLQYPCPLERVLAWYRAHVARLGLGECSHAEWREMCGGVSLAACDAEAVGLAAGADE